MRCSTTAGNGKSCGSAPSQSHNDATRSARFLTFASALCRRLSQRRKIGYVGPRGKSRIDQTGMPMTAPITTPMTASRLATFNRNLLTLLIAVSLSATAAFAAFAQGGRPQRQAQAQGEQQQ